MEQCLLQCLVVPVHAGGQPPEVAPLCHEPQPPSLPVQGHDGTQEGKGEHLGWRGGEDGSKGGDWISNMDINEE